MVIDLASGIFIYAGVSLLHGAKFDWLNLLLTISFAFSPDGDFVIFAVLRKRLKLASHHIIHLPLLLIPICFGIGYWWQGYYGAILFSFAVASHFFHDSFNPTGKKSGIRWWWPFDKNLYCIEIEIHRITPCEWDTHLEEEVKGVEKRSWWDEVMSRMEPAGPKTKIFLIISVVLLASYFSISR